jgi:hypothetical protein
MPDISQTSAMQPNYYFGACPQCQKTDGYTNIGPHQWFFCKTHKVKWWAGTNIFSDWRDETEDEQRANYGGIGLGEFKHIEPIYYSQS